jgi:AraC-like DNA-binding protein
MRAHKLIEVDAMTPARTLLEETPIARVAPVTVRHAMRQAARRGVEATALCAGMGFVPADLDSEDFQLSAAQCARLIRRLLCLLSRPALGLELGTEVNMVSWGAASLGFMACATSRALLDFVVASQRASGRLILLRGEARDGSFGILADAHFHERDVATFLVDETFAALTQICRQVVGPHFNPLRVDLMIERPAHAFAYEQAFRCPVRFGRAEHALWFPAEPYAVRSADALVLRQVERWLAPAEGGADVAVPELEEAVLRAIRRDLAHPPSLGEIAASLGVSERTLRRRLSDLGHTYAALLDQERKARALALVQHSSRATQAIAAACGFADTRTLQRAIKRWTGRTPTDFRRAA